MSTARCIRIVSCNSELNGNGDYEAWLAMQQRLAYLHPMILCRQETFLYAPTGPGATLFGESKRITKLVGDLGPGKHATALYGTSGSRGKRKLPVLAIGMDSNSYIAPERLVPGELPLPRLDDIADLPHRAHRSYEIAPGQRVIDSEPDRILLSAGLEDVARHAALQLGEPGLVAVAPTVDACDTSWLLPAVVDVEVVDMTGLSDHHTVVVTYDLDTVIDLCHARFALTA
jgi:hypothetical protein